MQKWNAMHLFHKQNGNGSSCTGKSEIGKFHEFFGKRIGRFIIEKELGDGGTSIIHLARDTISGQSVAIKTASGKHMDIGKAESYLEREEKALSALDHPHIIKLISSGIENGRRYIVTEFIDSPTVGHLVSFSDPMPWTRARLILVQLCSALAQVHERGMVHSDVKAYNIFLTGLPDGFEWAKLFDFGLVKFMDKRRSDDLRTPTGFALGTSSYMAPEQSYGENFDHRADIYSTGVLMYSMICGALPFEADNPGDMIMMHRFDHPTPPRERRHDLGISPKVEKIILKAMEKDPMNRFQCIDEMKEAIEKSDGS